MVDFNKEQDMVQNTSSVLEFPVEILLQILSYLDAQSLIRLSAMSRRLRILAYDRSLWRNVTLIYPMPTIQCQYRDYFTHLLIYFSRLIERTPLRYECLRSVSIFCVRYEQEYIATYEVARDLMFLTRNISINVDLVYFRYVYHMITGSLTTSGGHPYLLHPDTSRNDLFAITMPTPDDRYSSMVNNQYLFGLLRLCHWQFVWLLSV